MSKDDEMVDTMPMVDTGEEGPKRRVWSEAMKRQLVAETAAPGQSVSIVARRHDLNANLLFKWRRLMRAAGEISPNAGDGTTRTLWRTLWRPRRRRRSSPAS